MDVFGIGLACLSGAVMVVNGITQTALWPVTALACPPGATMTLDHGCDDRVQVDSAGGVGRCVALLCCLLSAGAIWRRVDATAALLFGVMCCLLSTGVGMWGSLVRQPVVRRR